VPASPEEVAWRKGYIADAGLERLIEPIASSEYGKYLERLLLGPEIATIAWRTTAPMSSTWLVPYAARWAGSAWCLPGERSARQAKVGIGLLRMGRIRITRFRPGVVHH
jgi:hypothetical protein